jgi:membrane protease YdiL (CAAX protease family)
MKTSVKKHPLISFFVLANIFSWAIWLPLLLDVQRTGNPDSPWWWLHYAGGFGPMLAAVTMTAVVGGKTGLITLFKRIVGIGANKKWVLVAVGLPLLLFVAAVLTHGILTGEWIDPALLGQSAKLPGYGLFAVLAIEIFAFGFGEETGWRGFALPVLKSKYSALISSLILTAPWALWHLPTFFYNENMMTMGLAGTVGWVLSLVTGSIILTWIFNGSRGSILVVALFHGMVDVVFTSQAVSGKLDNYVGAMITFVAIAIIFSLRKQTKIAIAANRL